MSARCGRCVVVQNVIASHESNGLDIIVALLLSDINPLRKQRIDLVLQLKVTSWFQFIGWLWHVMFYMRIHPVWVGSHECSGDISQTVLDGVVLCVQNSASKLLLAIMESRHDSENAERILLSIQRFQLLVGLVSFHNPRLHIFTATDSDSPCTASDSL